MNTKFSSRLVALALFAALGAHQAITAGSALAQDADTQADEAPESQTPEAGGQGRDAAARAYSLEELFELAGQNAAVIDEHRARIEHAQWRQYRANRAWGPRLESNTLLAPVPANADPTRIDENIDEILAFNIGPYVRQSLRVIVPVYTFGRISIAKELAELGVDVAQLQAEQARLDHFVQIQQAYYGRQLSQAFAELLAEGDTLIKDNLERIEEDREFGESTVSTADLRRLQIFNAEFDSRMLDNQRLSDLTSAALAYLAGLEEGQEVRVRPLDVDAEVPPLHDLAHYQALAMVHRPEVLQLERAVAARGLQVKLARRNFYPNLAVAVDFAFGWSTEDVALQPVCRMPGGSGSCIPTDDLFARPYSNPFDTLSFGIALALNWNINFFQVYGELQESRAQQSELYAQRERALGAIRLEITRQYREAADAFEKIEINRRRLDAARRWRNQFGLRTQMATGDIKDALDPLRAYYEARVAYLEAHHNYLAARTALARAVGLRQLDR